MNRHGDKQGSTLLAHSVYRPAAVCDRAIDPDSAKAPRVDAPVVSAPPFSETEGVLYALTRMLEQRDSHTAGHSERLAVSGVALGVAMRLDSASPASCRFMSEATCTTSARWASPIPCSSSREN
jgi:HD-GYP domain-containing protein (c-di-GMP phosphodiesterase class II)